MVTCLENGEYDWSSQYNLIKVCSKLVTYMPSTLLAFALTSTFLVQIVKSIQCMAIKDLNNVDKSLKSIVCVFDVQLFNDYPVDSFENRKSVVTLQ